MEGFTIQYNDMEGLDAATAGLRSGYSRTGAATSAAPLPQRGGVPAWGTAHRALTLLASAHGQLKSWERLACQALS